MGVFCLFLLVLIAFDDVVQGGDKNSVEKAFADHQLVPDILFQSPKTLLNVSYPKTNKTVSLGNEIAPVDVKEAPKVTYKINAGDFYTLQFVDPDAPSRADPILRSVSHWLVVNIPGSDVPKGQTLTEYIGSGPPKGSGLHRYVYLLYKQPSYLNFEEKFISNTQRDDRLRYSAQKFAEKYKLELVAGNFYRAQYDDSVLELQKRLNIKPSSA